MTNEQRCRAWLANTIDSMKLDEFCRLYLAFCEGYDDGKHGIKCVDVCGHDPNEDCDGCPEKVRAWMRKESEDA